MTGLNSEFDRYPTPGLPELSERVISFKAEGPVSALIFIVLWDWLLCRVGKGDRLGRAEARSENQNSPAFDPEEWSASPKSAWNMPRTLPDRFWNRLFMETSLQLPFPIHAALWANFCDEKGDFPEKDVESVYLRVVPKVVRERALGSGKFATTCETFLRKILSSSVPTARLRLPHAEVSCHPSTWTHLDRDNLVHNHVGPARVWADGSNVYFWRGVMAPSSWFPPPSKEWLSENTGCPVPLPRAASAEVNLPSPWEALGFRNVELRRVACEILGWEAIVSALKPVILDEDEDPQIGTLLRVRIPIPGWGDRTLLEDHVFLRVRCGTGRTFCLAVPPEMKTARQANAWTYGLEPEEYAPEVRT